MKYFTSDPHYGHTNVIKYCDRPFKDDKGEPDIGKMHRALIDNWNATVSQLDEVYMLGDWSMHNAKWYLLLKRLNFSKLYWVVGNHDKRSKLEQMLAPGGELEGLKVQVFSSCYVELGGKQFYCVHRPIQARDDMPSLCGHVHEVWSMRWPGDSIQEHSRKMQNMPAKLLLQPILNVGVDRHNFRPISETEVLAFFDKGKPDV